MRVELIYNPQSGPAVVRRELAHVVAWLTSQGCEVVLHETSAPLEATDLARDAARREVDLVVAVGGDGTVNEVASGLVHSDTVFGVLPTGTTNVWALQMKIPTLNPIGINSRLARLTSERDELPSLLSSLGYYRSVLIDAARVLLEGRTVQVDVGKANDRYFLLWAGVGLDAAVTINVSLEHKKAFGPLSFVGATLETLRDYPCCEVKLTLDGQPQYVNTALVIVTNIQLYAGTLPMGARACVNDGRLDVCVFRGEGVLNYVQHVLKVVSRQHVQDPEIDYMQASEILVESARPLPVHVDDEPFAMTPVSIRVVPRSLRAIVPHAAPDHLFAG
jgi:diacylglycerol kinase family enzyme